MMSEKTNIKKIESISTQLRELTAEFVPLLTDETIKNKLSQLSRRSLEYKNGSFIMLVVGPVKSGKSTLVNLLAHRYVSPTDTLECTVRPSIISNVANEKDCKIEIYKARHEGRKAEDLDLICLTCFEICKLRISLLAKRAIHQISAGAIHFLPGDLDGRFASGLHPRLKYAEGSIRDVIRILRAQDRLFQIRCLRPLIRRLQIFDRTAGQVRIGIQICDLFEILLSSVVGDSLGGFRILECARIQGFQVI